MLLQAWPGHGVGAEWCAAVAPCRHTCHKHPGCLDHRGGSRGARGVKVACKYSYLDHVLTWAISARLTLVIEDFAPASTWLNSQGA